MKITLLIPCYNEEKTIRRCVESALGQTYRLDQILVVNDSSTDKSGEILATFGDAITVVTTPKNSGNKSHAQEYALQFVTGDVLLMTDADTILAPDFAERMSAHFNNPAVHAVAGYIKSLKNNWITACRELDYMIAQDVHKKAQAHLNAIMVIPGCAAGFRVETFRRDIQFDHDTLTEDLDFTYKFHQFGHKIYYDTSAVVYTQDPWTIHSYINQTRRWIGGGWQNMLKHKAIIARRPGHALELGLIYFEGLIFGSLFFILPLVNVLYFVDFFIGYFTLALFFGAYGALRRKRFDLLKFAPLFPFMLICNSLIFFEQFIKEVILRRRNLVWFKPERTEIV